MLTILQGDALLKLRELPTESVQCCVTSPPYWGLRDYSANGQLGLEKTPEEYVAKMVDIFREVRRVLRKDGTLWLNLGDSYCAPNGRSGGGTYGRGPNSQLSHMHERQEIGAVRSWGDLPAKNLIGIPWRVAFALQADGWWLRQDIIWNKPNPMPESVTDRCTKSHEYIFLLTKSARYFYDANAITEPLAYSSIERLEQPNLYQQTGSDRVPGKTNGNMKAVFRKSGDYGNEAGRNDGDNHPSGGRCEGVSRNKRSVWTVTTAPYPEAHFATYPPDLIKPCILAGSRAGDPVLDPFAGSGTTGQVSLELGRRAILIELNPAYIPLIKSRCSTTIGLPL